MDFKPPCQLVIVFLFFMSSFITMMETHSAVSSSLRLERFAREEKALLKELNRFLDDKLEKIDVLARFYEDRKREFQDFRHGNDFYERLEHPNAVYNTIMRFGLKYTRGLGEHLKNIQHQLKKSKKPVLPLSNDRKGAHTALIRLKNVYRLRASDMAAGRYERYQGPPLDVDRTYEIGKHAFEGGYMKDCLEWLNVTVSLLRRGDSPDINITIGSVTALIGRAQIYAITSVKLGEELSGWVSRPNSIIRCRTRAEITNQNSGGDIPTNWLEPLTDNTLQIRTIPLPSLYHDYAPQKGDRKSAQAAYDMVKYTDPDVAETRALAEDLKSPPKKFKEAKVFDNEWRLCRRKNNKHHVPNPFHPSMKCRYRSALLPWYNFKEEFLSVDPFVSVFYNFTSERETTKIIDHAKPAIIDGTACEETSLLYRATVTPVDGYGEVSDQRTSDVAWIKDEHLSQARLMSLRIKLLTGLEIDPAAEPLQVVNYGLGGHYVTHWDFLKHDYNKSKEKFEELKAQGDRMATFLIYLSDVTRGGSTVFTRGNITVSPVKHMALFWYNYTPAFDSDHRTLHTGCPVLIGHKWIANKWIWSTKNEFRRRCGPKQDSTDMEIEKDMKREYMPKEKKTRKSDRQTER